MEDKSSNCVFTKDAVNLWHVVVPLKFDWKALKAGQHFHKLQKKKILDPTVTTMIIEECYKMQENSSNIRALECFLEAIPQYVLQLYIIIVKLKQASFNWSGKKNFFIKFN